MGLTVGLTVGEIVGLAVGGVVPLRGRQAGDKSFMDESYMDARGERSRAA